jgi:hypothetical protein
MSLEIDMQDPNVQRLLGTKRKRELVQIAGDAPDPTGNGPNGEQTTYHLNRSAVANPLVAYKDFVLECDAYQNPGEPLLIHLICPRCHNALNISSANKHVDLELNAGPDLQGRLSIEPFACTWEMPDAGKHVPGLISGGMTLCRWRVGIENNVARDA